MYTVYDKNMRALKNKNEEVWKAVNSYEASEDNKAFISYAKNGDVIVGYHTEQKDYYLNSTYNPIKEAEKLVGEYLYMYENSFLTIYGLANGMFASYFLEHKKNDVAVYVYEPSIDIFITVLRNIDITKLLNNDFFYLCVEGINESDFASFLYDYISCINEISNVFISIPIYESLFKEGYDRYKRELKDKYDQYRIQLNTMIKMGKDIGLAGIRNMRYLPNSRCGNDYKNFFPKDIPAIIVAAGPSLKKNVQLLKEVKGKAVTIVVDSAINTVMSNGIIPDFVITVDTHKELKNFTAVGLDRVFFLADFTANTEVLDMVKPQNLVFYSTESGTWKKLYKEEGTSLGGIFAGGSVALDAMALALDWGFKRIIMIGQDLAMTGNQQYADSSQLKTETKFNSPTLYVKDIYGQDVLTKLDYYNFIQDIEELAYRNKDVEFIDATEGGAYKKHTKIMTLREAIDSYCVKEYDIVDMIERVPKRFKEKKKIIDALLDIKADIIEIKENMKCGAEWSTIAANMMKNGDFNKDELIELNNKIKKVDDAYSNSLENVLIKKVSARAIYDFDKYIYHILDDDIAESIRLYENSVKLYNGIADSVDIIIDEVDKVSEQLLGTVPKSF